MRIAENFPTDGIDYRKSRLISEIESSITSLKVTFFFLVVSGGERVGGSMVVTLAQRGSGNSCHHHVSNSHSPG
jgi:hypothetical protein